MRAKHNHLNPLTFYSFSAFEKSKSGAQKWNESLQYIRNLSKNT